METVPKTKYHFHWRFVRESRDVNKRSQKNMRDTIDISKIDKAELLAALYNASKQQGLGFLDLTGREPMTKRQAAELLKEQNYFDYVRGRVMKIDLSGNQLYTGLYNRDNGE